MSHNGRLITLSLIAGMMLTLSALNLYNEHWIALTSTALAFPGSLILILVERKVKQ